MPLITSASSPAINFAVAFIVVIPLSEAEGGSAVHSQQLSIPNVSLSTSSPSPPINLSKISPTSPTPAHILQITFAVHHSVLLLAHPPSFSDPTVETAFADPMHTFALCHAGLRFSHNPKAISNHWASTVTTGAVCLETAGSCAMGGKPDDLIIGPGAGGSFPYSNSNPSISGRNPQIENEGVFVLSITGVNVDTSVSNVVFNFGTGPDSTEHGTPGDPPPAVPEPSSLLLLGTGAFGAAGTLRRKLLTRS